MKNNFRRTLFLYLVMPIRMKKKMKLSHFAAFTVINYLYFNLLHVYLFDTRVVMVIFLHFLSVL